MGSQFDIGFDTRKKLWFIEGSASTRWKNSMLLVKDSNIKLENVLVDSYCWADPQNEIISHGRIRFYGGNKIEAKGDESVLDSIKVTGRSDKFKFIEIEAEKVLIKYNLPSMDWALNIDGTELITKDIKGLISGTLLKDKLRFELKGVKLLYSNLVTLINPELKILKQKKRSSS